MTIDLNDAAAQGDLRSVRQLLATGADVHARGTLSRTCMHFAAVAGRADVCDLLIVAGAEVDALDYQNSTALHMAAGVGAIDFVRRVLAAGADPAAMDTYKNTPLHLVAGGGGKASGDERIGIVDLLLDAGCPLDAQDSAGRTPLWYAAATGTVDQPPMIASARLALLERLLQRGADPHVSARGTQGTPLDAAHGRHQARAYARVWPEAVARLQAAVARAHDRR